MEGQPVVLQSGRAQTTVLIRERIPSRALSPRGLIARLLWAFSSSGRRPSFEDYQAARQAAQTTEEGALCDEGAIDKATFDRLCQETSPDPLFSLRDHPFRPQLRDREGHLYQILRISRSRIDLVREDGTTGTTTQGEFDLFFFPVEETPACPDSRVQTGKTHTQTLD